MSQLEFYEVPFNYLGLNTPVKRFMATGLVVGGIVYALKPSVFFDEKGSPRPWTPSATKEQAESSTWIPWWTVPVTTGLIASLLI